MNVTQWCKLFSFLLGALLWGNQAYTQPFIQNKEKQLMSNQKQIAKAKELFDQAARLEYQSISDKFGVILLSQRQEAHRLYQEAYQLGYKQAAGALGLSYIYNVKREDVDFKTALKLFEEGRTLQDTTAIRGLALFYREGWLSPRDDKRMIELYEEAAALGDNQAQFLLGVFFSGLDGYIYVEVDPYRRLFADVDANKGLYWLKTAADNGNLQAWELLAEYYNSKEKNPKNVEHYLRTGIKKGNAHLMLLLAYHYRKTTSSFAEDLTREQRKEVADCISKLYSKTNRKVDTPIPNLDELCPRKPPRPVE